MSRRQWSKDGIAKPVKKNKRQIDREKNFLKRSLKYKNNRKVKEYKKRIEKQKHHIWKLSNGLPYMERVNGSRKVKTDGVNSFPLLKHPIKTGTRRQKFQKPPIECSIFYNRFKEVFDHFEINVDKCVISKGCWETNKTTLQKQLVPDVKGDFLGVDEKSLSRFDVSCRNAIRKMGIVELPKCTREQMIYTTFNKETYPGFRYSEYLLKENKSDAVKEALEIASTRWDRITDGDFSHTDIIPSIYTIGARNKRDFTYEENEEASSRVVHMPEFHTELTSGPWTDQITEHLKMRQEGPIFIGNSSVKYQRLEKAFDETKRVLEGDWRKFDSSIYLPIIICAISILRLYYDLEDEEIDNHFLAIFDCIGIKDYYTAGGNMVRAIHGIPSGVKSTNLLGSIVNLIALNFCTNSGANRDFIYVTGGDDFCVGVRKEINESFIEEMKEKAAEIGMEFKFIKLKLNGTSKLEELPCFYKYVVTERGPSIPTSSMLERVFMPWNKQYDSLEEISKFLNDVMPSLGVPGSNLILYYLFYQYIYMRYFGRRISIQQVFKRHERVYNKMMTKSELFKKESQGEMGIPFSYLKEINFDNSKYLTNLKCFKE